MPQPPSIPLGAWWVIAVAASLAFLAYFVPAMPNRRYKIQLSLAPFGAALLIAAHGVVKHCNAEVSLPLYVSVILGFLLGFAGRRKELREKARDIATNGNNRNNQLSKAAQVQVVVVIIIMAGVGSWLSMVG